MIERTHKMMTVAVTFPVPQAYSKRDAVDYVKDAVRSWGGQLSPEDEFFDHFENAQVKIVKQA